MACVFAGLALGWGLNTAAWGQAPPLPLVRVFSNGLVVCPAGAFAGGPTTNHGAVRFDFGLPASPPVRRALLDDLPILETEWLAGGVRYVQRVLVTRLGAGPLTGDAEDAVLVVQIFGESGSAEYTNASASLAIQADGEPWSLELRGGWLYRAGAPADEPLAFLDVPAVGIVSTNGVRLRFQGHMPPANSGAMTLYVPRRPLRRGPVADALADLDFNEVLNRVKDFWRSHAPRQAPAPLAWGDNAAPPAKPRQAEP